MAWTPTTGKISKRLQTNCRRTATIEQKLVRAACALVGTIEQLPLTYIAQRKEFFTHKRKEDANPSCIFSGEG
jgi:hypothetical protein